MSERKTGAFDAAIAAIDHANAQDPNAISVGGTSRPAELVYGERMTEALARFRPDAPEALKLAARAQHIQRWQVPRDSYPDGRVGYLKWRTDLKNRHADAAGTILADCGYDDDFVQRVQSLIRKERPKRDADSQALEDVICHVFLEFHLAEFAAKHEDAKVVDILRKTWKKMSKAGQDAALALPLDSKAAALVERALSD